MTKVIDGNVTEKLWKYFAAPVGAVNVLLGHYLTYKDSFLVYLPLAHVLEYIVELAIMFPIVMHVVRFRTRQDLTDALSGTAKEI